MISDLGFQATPVSLLASLRYFLAPLSVWAGEMSDRFVVLGYRRLFWVWLGRLMMALSMVGVGFLTAQLVGGASAGILMWGLLTGAMLLFSLGNAFSGSTFLALVYDRAPEHQRGRAVGIVWTFLLTGFAVGGAFFSILLPTDENPDNALMFSSETVLTLFIVAAIVMSILWFISLLGEERRQANQARAEDANPEKTAFLADLRLAFKNPTLRMFMSYLALSMMFSFSQDAILEPFAGDVFGMSLEVTTRFAAYWGTTAILGSLLFLFLSRKFKWLNNNMMSKLGVGFVLFTFVMYVYAGLTGLTALIMPGLLTLGLGLGMWNIGTLGLMMEMSPDGRAGTFLGFWTMLVTLARGVGVSGGGILRDAVYNTTGNLAWSYVAVFAVGALGLAVAYAFLIKTDTDKFVTSYHPEDVDTAKMLGAALD